MSLQCDMHTSPLQTGTAAVCKSSDTVGKSSDIVGKSSDTVDKGWV